MIGAVIGILVAMLVSFGLGVVVILFTGGKTTLQYIQCKMKRTHKIFMWVDTFTGRESVVGTIEGDLKKGVVSWNYNKTEYLTIISQNNVKRWKDIYYMGVNLECPIVAYDITKLGEMPVSHIDIKEYQNILNRALTKPSLDEDMTSKLLIVLAIGIVIIIGILVVMFFKINGLIALIEGLNVL
jgi:hypothetical protein